MGDRDSRFSGGIEIKSKGLLSVIALAVIGVAGWTFVVRPMLAPANARARYIQPRWQREKGAVWTAIGRPGQVEEAIVGPGGEIQPFNTSYTVSFWVYDRSSGVLYAPDEMSTKDLQWRLMDGCLPIPISTWRAGDVSVEVTNCYGTNAATKVKLTNNGSDKRLYLYVTIRPIGVSARYNTIESLKFSGGAAYVNGHRAIEPLKLSYEAGANRLAVNGVDGDISRFATRGKLPQSQSIAGPSTGAFRYDISLKSGHHSAEFGFVYAPSNAEDLPIAVGDIEPDDLIADAASMWQSIYSKAVQIEIPDRRMEDSFYTSLAYLMILQDGPYVVPGPLAYNEIWVRDATYAVDALMKAGMQEQADDAIEGLLKLRSLNGLMPPVFNMKLEPLPRSEWDSQGQLLYMIAQRYRLTGDAAALAAQYPVMTRTCAFIREIRKRNLLPEMKGSPYYGIMPPSNSAEDIGSAGWHHYWDDFWCIRGLSDAADMADVLGKPADALWMRKEAEDLRTATIWSIKLAAGSLDWIPNGPEDLKSSSAARGTTAGVWPTGVLSTEESRPAFQQYWDKWVRPNKGGFMHGGKLWPYATLSLAHAYLWNGDTDKAQSMLRWTLEHQTAPGVYAWSEVVDPKSLRFAGGDMPHGWAAAEYVLLLRDMLVRDDRWGIVLLSGVPEDWLTGGKIVRVQGAPVRGGRISFEVKGELEKDRVAVNMLTSVPASTPIEIRLPTAEPGFVTIPGGKVLPMSNGRFVFPKGVTSLVITLGTPPVNTTAKPTAKPAAKPQTKKSGTERAPGPWDTKGGETS